ncbi:MAG: hypothetical protein O2779_03990, partial [Nanoarchaeota archaeon]|nr:hypothetical protein [Nanoarchaeota archaeon]
KHEVNDGKKIMFWTVTIDDKVTKYATQEDAIAAAAQHADLTTTDLFNAPGGVRLFLDKDNNLVALGLTGDTAKVTTASHTDTVYTRSVLKVSGQLVYEERENKLKGNKGAVIFNHIQLAGTDGKTADNFIKADNFLMGLITQQRAPNQVIEGETGNLNFINKRGEFMRVQHSEKEFWNANGAPEGTFGITRTFQHYYHIDGYSIDEKEYKKQIEAGNNQVQKVNAELFEFIEVARSGPEETAKTSQISEQLVVGNPRYAQDGSVSWEGDIYNFKLNDNGNFESSVSGFTYTKVIEGKTITVFAYIDDKTGKITTEDGEEVITGFDDEGKGKFENAKEELKSEALAKAHQHTSRRFFDDFEFKLNQYKGLSGISQFVIGKENIAKWRNNVDNLFSKLYLQQDAWESLICGSYLPKKSSKIITLGTSNGLYDVAGGYPIGERSQEIITPEGKEYIYKLSYSFRNPPNAKLGEIRVNIKLKGPNRVVQLYRTSLPVKEGEQFIRGFIPDQEAADPNLQRPPVVATSKHLYNKICITFTPPIKNAEGDTEAEICNLITEYQGRPTSVANTFGTVGSANFPPPTEADFNEAII